MKTSDNETREIIKTLQEIYSGDPWHGPSNKSVVESIRATELFKRYGAGHSIIELLLHILAWRHFVIRRLRGEPENDKVESENWIDITRLDNPDLNNINKKLDESQEELIRELGSIDDSKLSMVVEAKNYTFRKMLNGLIHHDLYHFGQISLLNRQQTNI